MAIDVNISGLNTVVDVEMAETALIDTESGQVITIEDYDNLEHKPQINGVTLSGNKTSSDIGVASASHTHTKSQITDFPSLSTVATSGSYNDLTDTPTIPDAVTVTQITSTGTNIADIDIGGVTTHLYAPSGGGGAGIFVAEYGVTTYADVKDAWDAEQNIVCEATDGDYTYLLPLIIFDDDTDTFVFCSEWSAEEKWATLASDDTWDDWINSIAQVQADWNETQVDSPALILNKPTIPTKTSDLNNDSGFLTTAVTSFNGSTGAVTYTAPVTSVNGSTGAVTVTVPTKVSDLSNDSGFISSETDPVFTASAAYGIASSDITSWNGKSTVSVTRHTTSGTNIADLTIDGTTTKLYAPTSGGGTVTDVKVDGTSVVTAGVASVDLTGKSDVGHTHTTSAITDFPSLATVATSGAYSDLTGKPSLATVATTGDYDDLTDKPTIPSKVSDLNNDSGFITSPNVVYCTCGTATSTVAKVATVVSGSLSSLNTGDQAIVKFTYANSATNPTLKVGSTTAKNIKKYGSTAPGTSAASSWQANSCILFVYDGTDWQMCDWNNSTYSEISATNIKSGTGSTTGLISGRRAKAAVEEFAPVKDVTVGGTSVLSGTTAVVPAIPTDTGDLTNGAGFITSYTETDPVFGASAAAGIASGDITNWNDKVDRATGDFDLDTTAVSGDDYNLTQALTDIGWLNDVIYTP